MVGDILVVLPTYNERGNIVDVLRGVLERDDRIEALVVDDSSPDGTADAVRREFGDEPRVHLMVRTGQRGRGRAGVAGFMWALDRDYNYIVEMDADGSHDPKYISGMIDGLKDADLVISSRLIPGGGERGRGALRRWITLAANFYLRLVLRVAARDCTSGYRAYRRDALAAVPWDRVGAGGPAIVQEVLYVIVRKGFRVVELPFVFEERRAGVSKLGAGTLVAGFLEAFRVRRRHKNIGGGGRDK